MIGYSFSKTWEVYAKHPATIFTSLTAWLHAFLCCGTVIDEYTSTQMLFSRLLKFENEDSVEQYTVLRVIPQPSC